MSTRSWAGILGLVFASTGCSDPATSATPADPGSSPSAPDAAGSQDASALRDNDEGGADAGADALSPISDASPDASERASLQSLGDAPDAGSRSVRPWGISRDGRVVVGSTDDGRVAHAFRWTEATGVTLLVQPERTVGGSRANAVSDDGQVIAGEIMGLSKDTQVFRWNAGTLTPLGWLDGGAGRGLSAGEAMTPDGKTIVGGSPSANTNENGSEAFSWSNGGMTGLGDLPGGFFFSGARAISSDGTVIGGWGNDATGGRAVRWVNGTPSALPNLGTVANAYVNAVSGNGKVLAGFSQSGTNSWETKPVRWVNGGAAEDLGSLPGYSWGSALGTNADGSVIVGTLFQDANQRTGFVWIEGVGIRSLTDILRAADVNVTGWFLSEPRAVSADGRVVVGFENGNGTLPKERGFRAVLPAPNSH